MRIAFLSPFHPYRGGISQFGNALYRALSEKHEVTAFGFSRLYPGILFPGTSQYAADDDPDQAIGARRVLDSINPLTWRQAAVQIRGQRPEILLVSYWMPFFVPSLGSVARSVRRSATVVTLMHNVIPHEPKAFDRPLIRFLLRQAHGSVVMNRASEADLVSIAGPESRRVLIPHPVYRHIGTPVDRSEARARLGIAQEKRMILFFGLIREYKGVDLLIRAMDSLDDRHVLVIAGEVYGDAGRYPELIARSRMPGNMMFHAGYVQDSRVGDYFSAADVCVLPYRTATQSGITSLAYHYNLPVIATDVGGLGEDIRARGTGIVAGPPEAGAIADAIRTYFERGMKDECVRAIARVKEEENWPRFAEKLTAFAATL